MSTEVTQFKNQSNGILLEKVILGNDLSGLTPVEKVQHVNNICDSLGLNPLTKPIQLIKFQGREIPYVTKDGTDQLRNLKNISIPKLETKIIEGGVYVVTAYAQTPDNRQDSSTGVISISGLKGDALCNAMMKCESKAKRRVTLSICGLGLLNEDELDTMKGHQKVNPETGEIVENKPLVEVLVDPLKEYEIHLDALEKSNSLDQLKNVFNNIKKRDFQQRLDLFGKLIEAKDKRKEELQILDQRQPDESESAS